MESIKDAVQNVMQELETKKEKAPKDDPQILLGKVLTKGELAHVRFNYFKRGILNIKVDSSAWLYHLSLKKENLLARLSRKSSAIKDIHFRLGEIK